MLMIIIQSLELHQPLNTYKSMTGVSFTLLICNKAYKLFYLTLDRRVITQLRLYALTLHDVCYVGMYVSM